MFLCNNRLLKTDTGNDAMRIKISPLILVSIVDQSQCFNPFSERGTMAKLCLHVNLVQLTEAAMLAVCQQYTI